jgi:glutamyl-Q tRNA(Asp) synthetase
MHAGSLVAALASWLDAKAQGGLWLVRIEDVDTPRCIPGADQIILRQLADCGLRPDLPPLWQSRHTDFYQAALDALVHQGHAYPCACSRKEIEEALHSSGHGKRRNGELIYPGTCRDGLRGKAPRAWRLRTQTGSVHWTDRRLGRQQQNVETDVGDFVLKRADGLFAYQLAVVVDDAAQGVTHVVRGEDLADNTARQIQLQTALGLATPSYLHTPLVSGANGEKLSKQNGAQGITTQTPELALQSLCAAATALGLEAAPKGDNTADALARWTHQWRTLID